MGIACGVLLFVPTGYQVSKRTKEKVPGEWYIDEENTLELDVCMYICMYT